MKYKRYARFCTLLFLGAIAIACEKQAELSQKQTDPQASETESKVGELDAKSIHKNILTLDSHIDIPTSLGLGDADPSVKSPMQVDIPSMRSGGLDAGFFIVYVGQGPLNEEGYKKGYEQAQAKFSGIERMLEASPDDIVLVRSPQELRDAVAEGKLAAAIGIENAYPLGPKMEHLQEFYDRGARYVSLTHFGHNHFGDSSAAKGPQAGVPEPFNAGLSSLGFKLVDELNRLGIMVDVSHTAPSTTMATTAYSKTPVIASHSSVKAINAHPRNLSDLEIQAIADRGGVVQLVAFDAYLRQLSKEEVEAINEIKKQLGLDTPDWYKTASQTKIDELRRARAAMHSSYPRTTVADYVDHIEHVINLVGIDHAGIASDFGGGGGVEGWDYIDQTPVITAELLKRGYSQSDIEKIWSGNLLRVWQAVEDYAKKTDIPEKNQD